MLSNNAVQQILKVVNWSDLPKSISYALFPINGIPFSNWSLVNRVITVSNGSFDHRGRSQWAQSHRYLHKAAQPTFIVCPQLHHEGPDNESKAILEGFISAPVYPITHTYGDPIEYQKPVRKWIDIKPLSQNWNIKPDGVNRRYPVSTIFDEPEEEIAAEGEKEFVWQLCHEVYRDLFEEDYLNHTGKMLTLELTSLAMLHVIGRRVNYVGRYLSRIQEHAQEERLSSLAAFMSIIKTVELLFDNILETGIAMEN
jgi:hypothetical protein